MIIVHHLERSRSQRILWLLEELGLPYEVRLYMRAPNMGAPADLLAIHPLGKSPLIEDDGVAIAESGAIVEHLVEKAGKLGAPADPAEKLRYRYFLHYAEASLIPPMILKLMMGGISPEAAAARQPGIDAHLDHVEAELAGREWFAGDTVTGADIMMSFPLELAAARLNGTEGRPNIAAWLAKIHALPAYQFALAKGGPYEFA